MRPPRFGTGTLMLLVVIAALALALVAQHYRAARREYQLRADLVRLTPTPIWGGEGRIAVVGDRVVIGFHPEIFRREPGARYHWRFELVDPSSGTVALSKRDDRELDVPAGTPFFPSYLETLDRLPPPGEYLGRFILSRFEPEAAAKGWTEMTVHSETVVLPRRDEQEAKVETSANEVSAAPGS